MLFLCFYPDWCLSLSVATAREKLKPPRRAIVAVRGGRGVLEGRADCLIMKKATQERGFVCREAVRGP
jgi:hypothetical protein